MKLQLHASDGIPRDIQWLSRQSSVRRQNWRGPMRRFVKCSGAVSLCACSSCCTELPPKPGYITGSLGASSLLQVTAGTVNYEGPVTVQATSTGEDAALAGIARLVATAQVCLQEG